MLSGSLVSMSVRVGVDLIRFLYFSVYPALPEVIRNHRRQCNDVPELHRSHHPIFYGFERGASTTG